MKQKQITHWLKVIVIGVVFGFALQFVRAWTEPSVSCFLTFDVGK